MAQPKLRAVCLPSCPFYQEHNSENRYCIDPHNPKRWHRFGSRDPKVYTPRWCLRRRSPLGLRVFRFKGEESRTAGLSGTAVLSEDGVPTAYPSASFYKLHREETLSYPSIQSFYKAVMKEPDLILESMGLDSGDVLEVDEGDMVAYFYCGSCYAFMPARFYADCVERGCK